MRTPKNQASWALGSRAVFVKPMTASQIKADIEFIDSVIAEGKLLPFLVDQYRCTHAALQELLTKAEEREGVQR
jgi:hypothetical protein